mmetsp:Transcript_28977/g.94403  ORF Transcript_28977/g.94403 Transcript_28977/m.94403 type:complete len:275 (+) Transcript_28977:1656-2480(+)
MALLSVACGPASADALPAAAGAASGVGVPGASSAATAAAATAGSPSLFPVLAAWVAVAVGAASESPARGCAGGNAEPPAPERAAALPPSSSRLSVGATALKALVAPVAAAGRSRSEAVMAMVRAAALVSACWAPGARTGSSRARGSAVVVGGAGVRPAGSSGRDGAQPTAASAVEQAGDPPCVAGREGGTLALGGVASLVERSGDRARRSWFSSRARAAAARACSAARRAASSLGGAGAGLGFVRRGEASKSSFRRVKRCSSCLARARMQLHVA